jgi:hypothetical protein
MIQEVESKQAEQIVEDWQVLLEQIQHDITEWCQECGWAVERSPKQMNEEMLPSVYTVEVLTIHHTLGRLIFEPYARVVVGVAGRVDFYAYPTLNRVKVLYDGKNQEWFVRTDSGVDWPEPWSKQAFYNLCEALLRRR